MLVTKKCFPSILLDNEENYFRFLQGIIESIDALSSMEITRNPHAYHFRLCPSNTACTDRLIKELNTFHNMIGIQLSFSKSIKTSATIIFEVTLPD